MERVFINFISICSPWRMSFLTDQQCHYYVIFAFKIMTAYKQFITAVGKLLGGDDEMKKRAEEIVAFETKLAKVRTLMISSFFKLCKYVMTACDSVFGIF